MRGADTRPHGTSTPKQLKPIVPTLEDSAALASNLIKQHVRDAHRVLSGMLSKELTPVELSWLRQHAQQILSNINSLESIRTVQQINSNAKPE